MNDQKLKHSRSNLGNQNQFNRLTNKYKIQVMLPEPVQPSNLSRCRRSQVSYLSSRIKFFVNGLLSLKITVPKRPIDSSPSDKRYDYSKLK